LRKELLKTGFYVFGMLDCNAPQRELVLFPGIPLGINAAGDIHAIR